MRCIAFALCVFAIAGFSNCARVLAESADFALHIPNADFTFASRWQEPLTATLKRASPVPPAPYVMLTNPGSTELKRINDEHLQLLSGAVIVRAKTKPIFISQKMDNDKLMVRVAPGATALVSVNNPPMVANLSKRCCGAVLAYLPVKPSDNPDGKINVLAGDMVSIFRGAQNHAAEKSAGESESIENGPVPHYSQVQTSFGALTIRNEMVALADIMKSLAEIP